MTFKCLFTLKLFCNILAVYLVTSNPFFLFALQEKIDHETLFYLFPLCTDAPLIMCLTTTAHMLPLQLLASILDSAAAFFSLFFFCERDMCSIFGQFLTSLSWIFKESLTKLLIVSQNIRKFFSNSAFFQFNRNFATVS